MNQRFSAFEKFNCANRELSLRQVVYSKRIQAAIDKGLKTDTEIQRMKEKAQREIALMEDIARDYEYLVKLGERE